jgi:hypothetical protein
MHGSIVVLLSLSLAGLAAAKPEKIRSVQEPIYHLYLQALPTNSKFQWRQYTTAVSSSNAGRRQEGQAYQEERGRGEVGWQC